MTPLKPVTIPRMELIAAVVAARMDTLWRKELRLQLQDSVFWSQYIGAEIHQEPNIKVSHLRSEQSHRDP